MSKQFAQVALTNASREVDQTYTYRVPEDKALIAQIGMKVMVPFGMGNRMMEGIIFSFSDTTTFKRIKSITHFLDEDIHIDKKQLELVSWLRNRYLCTYSEALQAIMPAGTSLKRQTTYVITDQGRNHILEDELLRVFDSGEALQREDFDEISDYKLRTYIKNGVLEKRETFETQVSDQIKKHIQLKVDREKALAAIPANNSAQIRVINYLSRRNRSVLQAEVTKACRVSASVIRKLEQMEFVASDDVTIFRAPKHYMRDENTAVTLNEAQNQAYEVIRQDVKLENSQTYLLHGVTGSGKTEVYMKLAEDVLDLNKQCLVLVPEISLTPQIVSKFVNRFSGQVAVFHSKLSLGERFDQWKAVKRGELNIIIGARSALFAPCLDLGLIILDEEHDNAYKSDQNPKYRAVEVARKLGQLHRAPIVLGSATPSLETVHHVEAKDYKRVELKARFNDQIMPDVEIVDMRHELAMGNKTIFSERLFEAIGDRLDKKEQVILFLNRKGHSTFVSCRSCGFSLKCPNCEISLTFHKNQGRASCHYCGYSIHVPKKCPSCDSGYFKFFGTGTEKVEELTRQAFPSARVDRLDRQSVSRKGSMETILDRFDKRETDILIGTQMVTKGLDFENVTLVGVLSADVLLNLPDFQSGERAFQILTQVAGRAGRGNHPGEVVIQTYTPEHYAVQAACEHDHAGFIESEAELRKVYNYPPYQRLSNILISGINENNVTKTAQRLYEPLQAEFIKNKLKKVQLLGPNPAIYSKIKGKYRWQILIKSDYSDGDAVAEILRSVCLDQKQKLVVGETAVSVDIDAVNIL
ncbi:primosomal protein N' [Fusibacter sp. JL216-2]|uniref:primosomal protein N' n=1 Tax=Fusibacter sp. JL216-2 TaxID=3071453 RepID=UPI003D32875B